MSFTITLGELGTETSAEILQNILFLKASKESFENKQKEKKKLILENLVNYKSTFTSNAFLLKAIIELLDRREKNASNAEEIDEEGYDYENSFKENFNDNLSFNIPIILDFGDIVNSVISSVDNALGLDSTNSESKDISKEEFILRFGYKNIKEISNTFEEVKSSIKEFVENSNYEYYIKRGSLVVQGETSNGYGIVSFDRNDKDYEKEVNEMILENPKVISLREFIINNIDSIKSYIILYIKYVESSIAEQSPLIKTLDSTLNFYQEIYLSNFNQNKEKENV
jgi:hypothetical protein